MSVGALDVLRGRPADKKDRSDRQERKEAEMREKERETAE